LVGTLHGARHPDAHDRPSTSIRITSSYEEELYNAKPNT
jgi:hypothetical protein